MWNVIDYWGLVEALGEIGSGECYINVNFQ